jgi:PmbA protein
MVMIELDNLISLAERVVKKAEVYGAEEAEAYISWTRSINSSIQGGLIKLSEGETAGLGIRVVIGKCVGFAAVSSIDEKKVFKAAKDAIKIARIRPADSNFLHLPDPVKRPSKSGYFDDELLTLTGSDLMNKTSLIVKEAENISQQITFVSGGIGVSVNQFAVVNSRGINIGDSGTGIGGGIYCKAVEGSEERTGYESLSSRKLFDFSGIGEIAAKRAINSLGAKKLKITKKLPVLFDNYTSSLFLSLLSYGLSARAVQEKRSALSDKLDTKIACKNLTVIDDSWMSDGLNTVKYDAEGVPTTVKPVIKKGVLKNYLHNSYTALQEGKISTGNAARGGEDYLQLPGISPINYLVIPGRKSFDDLISTIAEGILVRYSLMGVGHSNFISGDFGVVASNAFYIKNKTVVHPLDPIMIAGNVYNALKELEVGSDIRLSFIGKIPSVLVSNLTCTP